MTPKFAMALLAPMMVVSATPALASQAEPAATTATAPTYSTDVTDIGTLLDNPATRAVLERHLPDFVGNPQIEMARAMTLRQVQGFAADLLTDEVLAAIDVDLAAIPAAE